MVLSRPTGLPIDWSQLACTVNTAESDRPLVCPVATWVPAGNRVGWGSERHAERSVVGRGGLATGAPSKLTWTLSLTA